MSCGAALLDRAVGCCEQRNAHYRLAPDDNRRVTETELPLSAGNSRVAMF